MIHEYSIPTFSSAKKEILLKAEWKIVNEPEIESITSLKLVHVENTEDRERKIRVITGTNSGKVFIYSLCAPLSNSLTGNIEQRTTLEPGESVNNITVVSGSPISYVSASKDMQFIYALNKNSRQSIIWNIDPSIKAGKPIKMESEVIATDDRRILISNGTLLTLKDCLVSELENM